MPFNDVLSDSLIRHDVSLLRFDAKLRRQVLGELRTLQDNIVSQLSNIDFTRVAKRQRLESLLQQVDSMVQGGYTNINRHMLGEMNDLAALEQSFQVSKMNELFGVDIVTASLTPETLRALSKNSSIFGAPAKQWWGRQSANLRNRFSDQMRQGFLLGESTGDLVRRVRGSATGARRLVEVGGVTRSVHVFSGGIMDVTTREAEALVRTSVQSVANEARLETYLKNTDVIENIMAQVTLDSRTSDICQSHGNRPDEWTLPDFDPVEGSNTFTGPPPWHFNCRSSLVPVTKSWEQLQKDGNKSGATRRQRSLARKLDNNAPKRTRASMNGQVPKGLGYGDWLRGQSKAVQLEVLGPGRLKMWKKGKLNLTQMIDQTGRPLTLNQLGELAGNKTLPLKLPPRQPLPARITPLRKATLPKPDAFIAPPPNIATVSAEGLRTLNVGQIYRFNGEVFKVTAKTRGGLESVKWSTRTGKFVSARNRTKITFGKPPPVAPPIKPTVKPPPIKPGPTTTTAGAPTAPFVNTTNYRTLKVGDIFKDIQGNVWKVATAGKRSIRAVPWSAKVNRFLTNRNGTTFGFTGEAATTVKKFTASTGSSREALNKLWDRKITGEGFGMGNFAQTSVRPLTKSQLVEANVAIKRMAENGFGKPLADMMGRNGRRVQMFNMGPSARTRGLFGDRVTNTSGLYYPDLQALGVWEGKIGQQALSKTLVHEFGHHMDYTIFRRRREIQFGKGISKAAEKQLAKLDVAYKGMQAEYREISARVGKKARVQGGVKGVITEKAWVKNRRKLEGFTRDESVSTYALYNEKEWFAETYSAYFNMLGNRNRLARLNPKAFEFYETLFSKEMDIVWNAL